MQVELEKNIYIQTYGGNEADIMYVNERLATVNIANEMSEIELKKFGLQMLDLIKGTQQTATYLIEKKKAYEDNPDRDGKVYLCRKKTEPERAVKELENMRNEYEMAEMYKYDEQYRLNTSYRRFCFQFPQE